MLYITCVYLEYLKLFKIHNLFQKDNTTLKKFESDWMTFCCASCGLTYYCRKSDFGVKYVHKYTNRTIEA